MRDLLYFHGEWPRTSRRDFGHYRYVYTQPTVTSYFRKKRKTYDDEKSFQVTLLHRERTENEIKRETVKEETW